MASAPLGRVLVTGGAGFIGSHTVLELVNAGYHVTVVDNLCNSSEEAIVRVGEITGKPSMIEFHKVDLLDTTALDRVFAAHEHVAVLHFAGLKAVGESAAKPLLYYENNISGTLNLLDAMKRHGCHAIVFSSSATVYGNSDPPFTEDSPVGVGITNPYGWTKFMVEQILRDGSRADPDLRVVLLRYFNPVGAHESGRIGEDPTGPPNNLMPFLQQVVVGRREKLVVFGDDYDTADGTAERDYIHVVDLALGHVKALEWLRERGSEVQTTATFNLGSGTKHSVLELLHAMERALGRPVPHEIGPRRAGDLPVTYAVATAAERELGWTATRTIDDMCRDALRWQDKNPYGYRSGPDDSPSVAPHGTSS